MLFQSALPRGERHVIRGSVDYDPTISIRAPARGATRFHDVVIIHPEFQSALPRGERQRSRTMKIYAVKFQSALPRGERLRAADVPRACGYFNPRSREGSDGWIIAHSRMLFYFNPRSREGSDQKSFQFWTIFFISIRAPARGATGMHREIFCMFAFQSALPRGERRKGKT